MTYTSRAMYTFTFLLLAGCAKEPAPEPIYLTSEIPDLPRECFTREIAPMPEPKLKAGQDATDIDAVRDREQWKKVFRAERAYRSTCGQRLDVLFPSKERSKPTS